MAYSPLYQNALQRSVPHLFRRPKTCPSPLSASPARRSTLREININTMSNKGTNEKSDMCTSESETPKLSEDSDTENFTLANTGFRHSTGDSDSNSLGSDMDLRNRFPVSETARLKKELAGARKELAMVQEELTVARKELGKEVHKGKRLAEMLVDEIDRNHEEMTTLRTVVTNLSSGSTEHGHKDSKGHNESAKAEASVGFQ